MLVELYSNSDVYLMAVGHSGFKIRFILFFFFYHLPASHSEASYLVVFEMNSAENAKSERCTQSSCLIKGLRNHSAEPTTEPLKIGDVTMMWRSGIHDKTLTQPEFFLELLEIRRKLHFPHTLFLSTMNHAFIVIIKPGAITCKTCVQPVELFLLVQDPLITKNLNLTPKLNG